MMAQTVRRVGSIWMLAGQLRQASSPGPRQLFVPRRPSGRSPACVEPLCEEKSALLVERVEHGLREISGIHRKVSGRLVDFWCESNSNLKKLRPSMTIDAWPGVV